MNTVEDVEDWDTLVDKELPIESKEFLADREKHIKIEELFRLSYSALSKYQSCPESYRLAFLDKAYDENGEAAYSDHYYAAVGSAIQAIFEAVINAWYADRVFDDNTMSDKYYKEDDFDKENFYTELFDTIDNELKSLKKFIVTFKQMEQKTDTDLSDNIYLTDFRKFPVDVKRYGNIIYIAQNKFLGEVKKLYKEPLKYFIDTILDNPNTYVECEKKVLKVFDNFKITGSIDFLVTNTKDNTSYVLDGKRYYNPNTNKDSQLLIYCYLTGSSKGGFFSYKENKIYWTLPKITEEMIQDLEKQLYEMYDDVKDWEPGVEQKEVLNDMCQYCDKCSFCKTYNEDITEI